MKTKYYLVGYLDNYKPDAIVKSGEFMMYHEGGDVTSRSPAYRSLEDLKIGEEILEEPCVICSGVVGTDYNSSMKLTLIQRNMCFSCSFWTDQLAKIGQNDYFVIDGELYMNGGRKDSTSKSFLGFAGREFKIKTNTGKIITTNNLWLRGKVTKWFKDKLPDNAEFIK
jgi:hypothetical protein